MKSNKQWRREHRSKTRMNRAGEDHYTVVDRSFFREVGWVTSVYHFQGELAEKEAQRFYKVLVAEGSALHVWLHCKAWTEEVFEGYTTGAWEKAIQALHSVFYRFAAI